MPDRRLALTPAERNRVGEIVTRFPGLASAVHAQATRVTERLWQDRGARVSTPAQLDQLLQRVVDEVAITGRRHTAPIGEAEGQVNDMVRLLARNSAAQARSRLAARLPAPPEPPPRQTGRPARPAGGGATDPARRTRPRAPGGRAGARRSAR